MTFDDAARTGPRTLTMRFFQTCRGSRMEAGGFTTGRACGGARPEGAGFSLVEMLVVMSIIGLLATLTVGLVGMAGRKSKETRIRSDMANLITAIDNYYAEHRFYPPDNQVTVGGRAVNFSAVTNQLLYELTGMVLTNNNAFYSPATGELLTSAQVQQYFHTDGFANSSRTEKGLRYRHSLKAGDFAAIVDNPAIQVLTAPVPWPPGHARPPVGGAKAALNPWRYVSSSPTNNPGRYDLWAEYVVGKRRYIIGNWSKEPIVIEE